VERTMGLPPKLCVKKGFGYNHKIMILRFRSCHLVLGNLWSALRESG